MLQGLTAVQSTLLLCKNIRGDEIMLNYLNMSRSSDRYIILGTINFENKFKKKKKYF